MSRKALILMAAASFGFTVLMAQAPEQTAWKVLHKDVVSQNAGDRRQALNALGTIGGSNEEAVRPVENALRNDKDPQVRQTAAAVLGQMKAEQSIPLLKQALNDKPQVAFTAAKALIDLGEETAAMGVFVDVLTGKRTIAPGKTAAAWSEAKRRFLHPQALLLMGIGQASGAFLGPGAMGIMAGEEAFKAENPFEDRGASGRALATRYLAKESDPYALTLLEWALSDSNWEVRAAAAKAVGERGNPASIPKLTPLLTDSHLAVRTMAAAAIIRLRSGNSDKEVADRSQP